MVAKDGVVYQINGRLQVTSRIQGVWLSKPELHSLQITIPHAVLADAVGVRMEYVKDCLIRSYAAHFKTRLSKEPALRGKVGKTRWEIRVLNCTHYPRE